MLQDESLEYIQEQYEEKNMVLAEYAPNATPNHSILLIQL